MKFKAKILIILAVMLMVSGCNKKTVTKPVETAKATQTPAATVAPTPITDKYYSPYTGEEVTKEVAGKPAVMSIIENSDAARPQAGLSSADIVFEFMAEGGITRFLALFQKDNADKIGPVRSMRTYFIDLAYEYNLPFAHCGGSHDALDRIQKEAPMSLDEMANGSAYYRDPLKSTSEHSLFTTSEKLISLATAKNYIKAPNVKLKFDKAFWDNSSLETANLVTVKFNGEYNTTYTFKDGVYLKAMNKVATLNRGDNAPVALKNIVIQNVNYRTRPAGELYLDADLVGQGDGYIISNGKKLKVKWSKADLHSQTIFKDEKGNIVPLNPGKTWWHILDQNAQLTVN